MLSLPRHAALLAFEGPDPYSMVGGLGTRVTELSAALAERGVATTLAFIGDPARPSVEQAAPNLEYRRWCRRISADYPGGVYDGEVVKMEEYAQTVPPFVVEHVVEPAARRGESVLIVAEDWQTAPSAIALDKLLRERKLRDRAILMWNANNTYGSVTIDWRALASAAQITTVSRYMKFELHARGVESLVIPNGIPQRLLEGAPAELVRLTEENMRERRPLFIKVARFDAEKRWLQAVDAFADLQSRHCSATLVVRGGREPYAAAILDRARELGLQVNDLTIASRDPRDVLEAIAGTKGSVVNVRSFVPEAALLALYRAADAVLANSGREPFGLVGLEVMAVGGVAVTGATGEDYVEPFVNAIVCDTGEPRELATYLDELVGNRDLSLAVRAAGEATARRFTWGRVLDILSRKLAFTEAPR